MSPAAEAPPQTVAPRRPGSRAGRELLFLAPGDVSKGRVEPISWMRTCEAYAAEGLDVTLAALRVRRPDAVPDEAIWAHFGVEQRFRLRTLPTLLNAGGSVPAFRAWATVAGGAWAARSVARALLSPQPAPIVHARAPVLLAPFAVLRRALGGSSRTLLVFETHALPKRENAWIVRSADLVVVNSEALAADMRASFGLRPDRVLHAPLPPHNPAQPCEKEAARRTLGLDGDVVVACYTGKMTREIVEFLLASAREAARQIPSFRLLLVGGNPEILDWGRRRISALGLADVATAVGFVAPVNVALYQSAADVLLYHLPESVGIFRYTTPAKGYEYQAMRRPIVATDFPLFDEVFGEDGSRAIRVTDRTPQGLARGIVAALELPDGGRAMTERAAAFVAERTWKRRSATILDALGA